MCDNLILILKKNKFVSGTPLVGTCHVGYYLWGGEHTGMIYDGKFKEDVPYGPGTRWHKDGSVYLKGNFTSWNTLDYS